MYRAIVDKLEVERRKEAAARNYENTAAIRDHIAVIKNKIFSLDCDHERRRQATQKSLFERAMTARATATRQKLDQDTAQTERTVVHKIRLSEQRAQLESQMLTKELAKWPMPKPRYSKGLIELRHAEMALAQDQRYEEAH